MPIQFRRPTVQHWGAVEKSVEQSQQRLAEIQQLLDQVLTEHEVLRASLARELHNELGALLTGMSLDLSGLGVAAGAADPETESGLDSARALLREAVALKRRFIERLYPSTLELLGLGAAIETLARGFGEVYGFAMEVAVGDVQLPAGSGLGIDLYRVAEAALENVARHASAGCVEVVLTDGNDGLVLVIRDDGTGVDPGRLASGTGFRLMRHRLGRWRGELSLDSRSGGGTALTARIPTVRASG